MENSRSATSVPITRHAKQNKWGLRSSGNILILKAESILDEELRQNEVPRIPEVKRDDYTSMGSCEKLHPTNRQITVGNALTYLKLRHDKCSR